MKRGLKGYDFLIAFIKPWVNSMKRGLKDLSVNAEVDIDLSVSQWKEDWKVTYLYSDLESLKWSSMKRGLKGKSTSRREFLKRLTQWKEDWKTDFLLHNPHKLNLPQWKEDWKLLRIKLIKLFIFELNEKRIESSLSAYNALKAFLYPQWKEDWKSNASCHVMFSIS